MRYYYRVTYHHIHFHCTFAESEAQAIQNVKDWYLSKHGQELKNVDINGVEIV